MEKIISSEEKIKKLAEYYKEKGLLILGLNDSQGVNTTPTFFRKGLLEYLAKTLTTEELTPRVINAFSLLMNKTEHIDYFLKSNLSLEEIKLSQVYSVVSAFEKVMTDIGLPKSIGQVGNIYRAIYTHKEDDENIFIGNSLYIAQEPTVIYSSGVNNLMREVGNNPFAISKDYKKRFETPNYNYTLEKANNPEVLNKVISGIDKNFETILSINDQADIYALGAYVPKSLQSKEMNIFRDLIIRYNEQLQSLCKSYHMTFINTEEIGKNFNNSQANFHISTAGHNNLANHILGHMYQNKITSSSEKKTMVPKECEITNRGPLGIIESTKADYYDSCNRMQFLEGYEKERELKIACEHQRETEVFQKVLAKTKRLNKI